jgi:nicotinamidase/pyrazinamidase
MVDVQNDFLPGGILAVAQGAEVIPVLSRCTHRFAAWGLPIFVTRCWHPRAHCSFQERGGPWPPHCVQGTWGAGFAPDLVLPTGVVVVSKGTQPDRDAYSAFDGTDLEARLLVRGVRDIHVGGLATDYCVLHTVLDGLRAGYRVRVLVDAVRAVEVQPGDGERAIAAMVRAGALLTTTRDLIAEVETHPDPDLA